MLAASNTVVGVDFGALRRARDQRRKMFAIAACAVTDRHYRVDAIGVAGRVQS
jgi:predicted unusual protein kinase regulating ubiquinone biosynthesis (AarF/ABC1/UbiB family)